MMLMKNKECGAAPLLILGAVAVLLYLLYGQLFTPKPIESVKEEKGAVKLEQQDLIEDREKVKTAINEALQKRILMKMRG